MPKSLTKKEYADYICKLLGGSVVDIELEDDIEDFIDLALLKVKPYIGSTKLITLPASDKIDLSDKKIYAVINVYRGTPIQTTNITTATKGSGQSDDAYLFNPGLFNYANNLLGITSTDSVAITILTNQVINQASGRPSDLEFVYDDDILYVELANAGCSEITVEYIPDYDDVSEITEPFWINYILNIAVAYTKIALGRARGKYKLSNLPYEMDSDTLLSEGNQELENLTTKLEDLNDINYIID
jgi:hypothetical protein